MSEEKKIKAGVVVADRQEFFPYQSFGKKQKGYREYVFYGNQAIDFILKNQRTTVKVTVVFCGIGKVNAAHAAAFLIADGADLIINAGLSGGISRVKRGDLVVAESTLEADFDLTPLSYPPAEKPGQDYIYESDASLCRLLLTVVPDAVCGKIACGDFFLSDTDQKEAYKKLYQIIAFDMESGAVASVCHKCGIPFLILRQISDDADDVSPGVYREINERADDCLQKAVCGMLMKLSEMQLTK